LTKIINQIYPWIDNRELYYLKKAIKSTFITENKLTQNLEDRFRKLTKAKFAIAINNWTLGIYACLKSLNIGAGDEVIVPDMTFIATSNAVLLAGAKVVLCDVNYETLCIDPSKIKNLINNRTKAVMPVHLYGNSCDLDAIKKLKKKKNFFIIEDAAQGVGVTYKNKHVGTIGDVGGFSFYGNKLITTGEGGMIVTNNKKIYNNILMLKNHGRKTKGIFIHKRIGYNFMFTDIQAAVGLAQMDKLKKIIKIKENIYNFYKKNLRRIKSINFIKTTKYSNHIHWFSNIMCKDRKLSEYLNTKRIQTRKAFYPLHMQPCYRNNKKIIKKGEYNNSKKIYKELISLPSAVLIKKNELIKIIKNINLFFKNNDKIRYKFN
jgi:perosamine synthetase